MYKLFLTIRYLTRKKIVIFPILVVWLCLMMMIIVTSIMGGFVDRVRETNRELLGDVVISSKSAIGWSGYDELRAALQKQFPEIAASSPVIEAYGLVNFPRYKITRGVMVVGIDPAERSKVSRFRETLFQQYIGPHEAADDVAKFLPATKSKLLEEAAKLLLAAQGKDKDANDVETKMLKDAQDESIKLGGGMDPVEIARSQRHVNWWWLCGLAVLAGLFFFIVRPRPGRTGWSFVGAGLLTVVGLAVITLGMLWPMIFARDYDLAGDRANTTLLESNRAFRTQHFLEAIPDKSYANKDELLAALVPAEPSFAVPATAEDLNPGSAQNQGCIAGVQLGIYSKDKRGNFERPRNQPYLTTVVTVFPVSATGAIHASGVSSSEQQFTIVDDSYTGVFDVDQLSLYAPFGTVQLMAGMRPDPDVVKMDARADFAPRCNYVLIKLKNDPADLKLMRASIQQFVEKWQTTHPTPDLFPLEVQTWDERQAKYLNAVENEKVMQTFILGLMSLVVLVVIFLIFYMIVRDKTRDIGIIKAIGGSEEGVVGIFLTYGLFIGIVGGLLGVISGVAFVTHTNEIHEWIYQMTGVVIWDRSVYLFDEIPHTIHPTEVAIYFCAALLAGVLGALIPAVVAGAENPVKAVRYE